MTRVHPVEAGLYIVCQTCGYRSPRMDSIGAAPICGGYGCHSKNVLIEFGDFVSGPVGVLPAEPGPVELPSTP